MVSLRVMSSAVCPSMQQLYVQRKESRLGMTEKVYTKRGQCGEVSRLTAALVGQLQLEISTCIATSYISVVNKGNQRLNYSKDVYIKFMNVVQFFHFLNY